MAIVCPNCGTSYAIDPEKFGAGGRSVRCTRCQKTWRALPETAMAEAGLGSDRPLSAGWDIQDAPAADIENAPHIQSPSISADWSHDDADQASINASAQSKSGWGKRFRMPLRLAKERKGRASNPIRRLSPRPRLSLPVACVGLGAAVLALMVWRTDVVRLLPQTAALFRMVGLDVNLRGLKFEDMKISTELVNDKPVLVIEGMISDVARKSVEIPRLRFIVRDAKGSDIYAWNAVLEQAVLNPGEKAWFKTRLASPPAEGREIAVRFFHKRDVASGGL